MADPRIIVLGGSGYFGRLLVKDLASRVNTTIVAVGRRQARLNALRRDIGNSKISLVTIAGNIEEQGGIERIVEPGDIIVDCAGPFSRGTDVARRFVSNGCHFIDISDARAYLSEMQSRADEWASSTTCIMAGASTLPALIVLVAKHAEKTVGPLHQIDTWMAAGTRGGRGNGTIHALAATVSKRLWVLRDGAMRAVPAWTEPREALFPYPVGRRVGRLASDADAGVLPTYFPALRNASFRAALEFPIANSGMGLLARVGLISPATHKMARPLLLLLAQMFGFLGTTSGGLLMEARGASASVGIVRISITRAHDAAEMAIVPASMAVQSILAGTMKPRSGWIRLDSWIPFDLIRAEFIDRGFSVVEQCARQSSLLKAL